MLLRYLNDIRFLIFPQCCEVCGIPLHNNEKVLCIKCLYNLPRTDFCTLKDNPITNIFAGRLKIERGTALFIFQKGSKYRKLLHKLKYNNKAEIGIILGKELGIQMNKSGNYHDIDYIIPIPLHKTRERQRGYNQSLAIARGLSEILKFPIEHNNLVRNIATITQTKMNKEERQRNVSGKFSVLNASELENKHVLLVDDVVTSGSTIEACGEILLQIKGLKLSIAVLAMA